MPEFHLREGAGVSNLCPNTQSVRAFSSSVICSYPTGSNSPINRPGDFLFLIGHDHHVNEDTQRARYC